MAVRIGSTGLAVCRRSIYLTGIALLLLAGCAAAPPRIAIPPFRAAVATADQQIAAAFADVNSFLRRQQIERALRQQALTEELFAEALASDDLAKWHRAFGVIDSYAVNLQGLLDPDLRTDVEGKLSALGEEISNLHDGRLPVGMSAAFTKLAGLLVTLGSERDALEAVRKADPAIQTVFSAMMEAIGADPETGVRGTVRASWTQLLARIDIREFRPADDDGARRAAVLSYVDALDERDAQDRLLCSLRLSLAALAQAHQELAQGRRVSAVTLLQLVQEEYKAYQEQVRAIRERREGSPVSGGTQ